jgi:hypothetical protein
MVSLASVLQWDIPPKPPKEPAQAFQKPHPGHIFPRAKGLDNKRHLSNIFDKTIHWSKIAEQMLKDPAILPENVYNMGEKGVILCVLGSVN